MRLVVNGKFTAQRLTGVQRVALELLRAVRRLEGPAGAMDLVVPSQTLINEPALEPRRVVSWLQGNLWGQISLPLAPRDEMLLSLCNSGPLFKRRHVVMVHDMAVYDTPHTFSRTFRMAYRLKFAMMLRRMPTILTVSGFSKQRICEVLDIEASRVRVVRPGADHFARIESQPEIVDRLGLGATTYCVIVGSLDPRKNLNRVLEAVGRLSHLREAKFVVIGGGNSQIFASDGTSSLFEQPNIVRAGYVTDGELKALYERAACLVFPSLYEGFGLPPVEAMVCGCPVIVSTHPALRETCGDAAMYCDALAVDDIAGKIECLVKDEALRETYRQKGLRHIQASRWDRAARELMKILNGETYDVEPSVALQSAL